MLYYVLHNTCEFDENTSIKSHGTRVANTYPNYNSHEKSFRTEKYKLRGKSIKMYDKTSAYGISAEMSLPSGRSVGVGSSTFVK